MNSLQQLSIADTLTTIRPGKIADRPFWNRFARQFIYCPAFEFSKVNGAASYRFHVCDRFGTDHTFTADSPDAPLTPIWAELPVGPVFVAVDAVDASGNTIARAGERTFYRNAPFNACYPPKSCSYADCARKTYEYLFQLDFIQELSKGIVDPDYPLSCYPSKMLSSIISGMVNYAEMNPERKADAMRIARGAADNLIKTAIPAGEPLEFFPLTYSGKVIKSAGGEKTIMMLYPASVGRAMLKLFAASGERHYLDYAIKIGEQYLKLQLPNGTWHLILNQADGLPNEANYCCPTGIMLFLEALAEACGDTRYKTAAKRGVSFFSDLIDSFNWEGQFEDVAAQKTPYQNLSKHIATDIYLYLGKIQPDAPEVRRGAREVQRFSEDQFIVWEQPGWAGSPDAFNERTEESLHSRNWGWLRWHTPCALEQYRCYVPVDASVAKMIRYFLLMYDLEKNPLDLAKARALGDSFTRIQCSNGRIPTWMSPESPLSDDWINCMFASAEALKLLAKYEEQ